MFLKFFIDFCLLIIVFPLNLSSMLLR
jgi:hypothetical protein